MNTDVKLFRWLAILVAVPLALAVFGGDRFRYPCQDPNNWDKAICQKPACDVTRTCPEHVFKGQRDPRLGPPDDKQNQSMVPPAFTPATATQGVNCGK
jgi:hypothetical protein